MTTLGAILILNTTMIIVNLTVLVINSSYILREAKKVK